MPSGDFPEPSYGVKCRQATNMGTTRAPHALRTHRLRRHRLETAFRRTDVFTSSPAAVGRPRGESRYADQPSMTYADRAPSKKVLQSSEFDAFAPRTRGVLG